MSPTGPAGFPGERRLPSAACRQALQPQDAGEGLMSTFRSSCGFMKCGWLWRCHVTGSLQLGCYRAAASPQEHCLIKERAVNSFVGEYSSSVCFTVHKGIRTGLVGNGRVCDGSLVDVLSPQLCRLRLKGITHDAECYGEFSSSL